MKLTSLLIALFSASAVWAQPANQTGIAHVAFRVADLEAAQAFYNKLGFEQFFAMKQGDKTTEAFLKVSDHQFIELYPKTDPAQPIGLMHICYESSDLQALHDEYVKRGLTVSDVRKAGAGNLLMTMKDPEGQTIEYTQYMPGSRHYEDRGKHLGAKRVAQVMVGAITLARDAAAMRKFYIEKLGFTEMDRGNSPRLRMPGDSGQEVDIIAIRPEAQSGIRFGVEDIKHTAEMLTGVVTSVTTAQSSNGPTMLTIADPDHAAISFIKVGRPENGAQK